ncbi:GNAT family N-acetyltransferase [Rufibacter psychrotolerans]|uniref:GNAT family N-acetyltransferase n=1 Tax=Rufibacter psychrotolerans TaxID=2812556 RepID=UPI001F08301B|nr:GNAT family N-acetyltransferase [Rufibacter sp. SYSU D00308]
MITKAFGELTPQELYDLLQLRSAVFVVEQNCVFLDPDGLDAQCHHLLFYQGSTLEAYARLLPAGVSYPERSIGRIITSAAVRGTGVGQQLVQKAIDETHRLFGPGAIKIGAQLYARKFYERFGFVQSSDVYDEDGIDHIKMIRPAEEAR